MNVRDKSGFHYKVARAEGDGPISVATGHLGMSLRNAEKWRLMAGKETSGGLYLFSEGFLFFSSSFLSSGKLVGENQRKNAIWWQ